MRRLLRLATIGALALLTGCAALGEAAFEGFFESCVDMFAPDRVDDDEARMLQRKGIEPGSKEHRRMKAEEEMWRDFRDAD